jgi:hypothetical protein
LAKQRHQYHRGQTKHDPELDQRRQPADAGGVDADRERIRHAQSVERHDPRQHEADGDIQDHTNHERAEDTDRQVAATLLGFLLGLL